MRRCPLHRRYACSCQRVRLSAIAPVNRNRAVRAAPQHRRCATVFKVNVYPRFSVVGDVHSTDFDSSSHRFDAVKRPVPALADKPAMFGQRRQFGQRGGFFDGVAVQYSAVVIAEIDRFRSGGRVYASTACFDAVNQRRHAVQPSSARHSDALALDCRLYSGFCVRQPCEFGLYAQSAHLLKSPRERLPAPALPRGQHKI